MYVCRCVYVYVHVYASAPVTVAIMGAYTTGNPMSAHAA